MHMTLILRGTALNEEPISQPLIGRFDERGGTLGRSDDSTLTLPDPERMISRLQAQVLYSDKHYWIENVSIASPILHNGRALSNGMRVVLSAGDELRIGGYALQVEFESDETNATILAGRTVVPGLRKVPGPAQIAAPAVRTPPAVPTPPVPALAAATPPPLAATLAEPLSNLLPPAAVRKDSGAESLWQAFLEGAGIDLPMRSAR
jgi:FHA domain-containing protein